jgi:hypothetical protein
MAKRKVAAARPRSPKVPITRARARAKEAEQADKSAPDLEVRDSYDGACGAPAYNLLDYGSEAEVTVKIKNTGRVGADCPFVVTLRDRNGMPEGRQTLDPGQSSTVRRDDVQVVEIDCGAGPGPDPRCKASYTIIVVD